MPSKEPIVKRYEKNPILTKDDVPYSVATVHNAGVVKHNDRYIMLFRSHLHNGRSVIGRADSDDGFFFTVNHQPFLVPSKNGIIADPAIAPICCSKVYGGGGGDIGLWAFCKVIAAICQDGNRMNGVYIEGDVIPVAIVKAVPQVDREIMLTIHSKNPLWDTDVYPS